MKASRSFMRFFFFPILITALGAMGAAATDPVTAGDNGQKAVPAGQSSTDSGQKPAAAAPSSDSSQPPLAADPASTAPPSADAGQTATSDSDSSDQQSAAGQTTDQKIQQLQQQVDQLGQQLKDVQHDAELKKWRMRPPPKRPRRRPP